MHGEWRSGQDLIGQCAGGLLARTIEALDRRGIAERFLSEGKTGQVRIGFDGVPFDAVIRKAVDERVPSGVR